MVCAITITGAIDSPIGVCTVRASRGPVKPIRTVLLRKAARAIFFCFTSAKENTLNGDSPSRVL